MPGNICQYSNCGNSSAKNPHTKFYRFPKDFRSETWKINSGNTKLFLLDIDKLHNRYLCQDHFSDDSFMNMISKKLTWFAVPCKYNDNNEQLPLNGNGLKQEIADQKSSPIRIKPKTYSRSKSSQFKVPISSKDDQKTASSTNTMNTSSPILKRVHIDDDSVDNPQKNNIKQTKISQKTFHKKLTLKNIPRKKVGRFKTSNDLHNLLNFHKFQSNNARAMVLMQLRARNQPWTRDEKNLVFTLFFKSPSIYKFLRLLKLNLPNPSTINNWLNQSKFLPGFNKIYLGHLKKKFEFKTHKEKICSFCFYEIPITKFLEYSQNSDFIEGFEDMGQYGRNGVIANNCLMFVARGIYTSWEIPIAYFLTHSTINCQLLRQLICQVLQELFDVGLSTKILICDFNTNNQILLKSFLVFEETPYLCLGDKKIFALFDTLHLFEVLRNNFIGNTFRKGEKLISFKDVVLACNVDKMNSINSLSKITNAHLLPNLFQKPNVKLAAQVFSNSMASSIRTSVLESCTASNTADFIDFMDKLFDCLNSKTLFSDNPYNSALTNSSITKSFLSDASIYFTDLVKVDIEKKATRYPCFSGFSQTINGILGFFYEESKKDEKTFLFTNRLNQGLSKYIFFTCYQKDDLNKNPTAKTIRNTFKKSSVFSLTSSKLSIYDNSQEAIDSDFGQQIIEHNKTVESSDTDYCSITYLSGYLANKCTNTFYCHDCEINLKIKNNYLTDEAQLLLLHKNYSNSENDTSELLAPSHQFKNIVIHVLAVFEKIFETIQHKRKIKSKLLTILLKDKVIKEWINSKNGIKCSNHYLFILETLLICTICRKTKSIIN